MKAELLPEPELEFGAGTHVDIRFGLSQRGGPFDAGTTTAPSTIRIGLVGTAQTLEGVQNWLDACRDGVAAKKTRLVNLFPAFPGFSLDSVFRATLSFHNRWTSRISTQELADLTGSTRPTELSSEAAHLFVEYAARVVEHGGVDVIVCAPPPDLLASMDAGIDERVDETESAIDEGSEAVGVRTIVHPPAFHDVLKAGAMRLGVPLQMIRPPTYEGGRRPGPGTAPLQDPATRAWNFHTALYYKAGGIPWRLVRDPRSLSTCFVGVSFYRALDGERLLTSVAQVFNERGEGIIVRGAPALLDKDDRTPHLSDEDAYRLLAEAIATYRREHKTMPARVALHKTSSLTAGEIAGFTGAARAERIEMVDLLSLRRSFTRLFRLGTNPPLRGTLLHLGPQSGILYLRGSVPFFETYPGMYVPRPLELELAHTDATVVEIGTEMMALSKLNWNNTQFDGGEPITVRAARRVGDILKCMPAGPSIPQPSFRFFM